MCILSGSCFPSLARNLIVVNFIYVNKGGKKARNSWRPSFLLYLSYFIQDATCIISELGGNDFME